MTMMMVPMSLVTVTSDLGVTHTAAGEPESPDAEVTLEARASCTRPVQTGGARAGGRERHQELQKQNDKNKLTQKYEVLDK